MDEMSGEGRVVVAFLNFLFLHSRAEEEDEGRRGEANMRLVQQTIHNKTSIS